MKIARQINRWKPISQLSIPLLLWLVAPHIAGAQRAEEPLPEVIGASVPFYPPIALAAHVSGVVRLHVAIDGKRVIAVTNQTGPAMLVPAAEENVRTWSFAESIATSFDVTFNYKIIDSPKCPDSNKPIVLRLPADVEVDGSPRGCDNARYFRQETFLHEQHVYAVELHIALDDEAIPNPAEVTISNASQTLTLPVKDGLIMVPESMERGSKLTLRVIAEDDVLEIPGISPSALKTTWNINLTNEAPAADESVSGPVLSRTSCSIGFDPVDGDGMAMLVDPCRKPIKK